MVQSLELEEVPHCPSNSIEHLNGHLLIGIISPNAKRKTNT